MLLPRIFFALLLLQPATSVAQDWTGATNNGWFISGNWSGGIPDGSSLVTINATANNPVRISGGMASALSLNVGDSNPGLVSLSIENGGSLNAEGVITLGDQVASKGVITVTGSGSVLAAPSGITIGNLGTGTLNVADGAMVTTGPNQITNLGSFSGSTGALNLNGTAGSEGVLETGMVFASLGSGTMHFDGGGLRALFDSPDYLSGFEPGDVVIDAGGASIDTNGHEIAINTSLSGPGGLTKQGAGTLILTGANSYAGQTRVVGGTLLASGDSALGSSSAEVDDTAGAGATLRIASGVTIGAATDNLVVQHGGKFTGAGMIIGNLELATAGTVVPDGGTLTVGSFLWFNGAVLAETIGGPAAATLHVTGPFARGGGIGLPVIALTDGGVVPGQTYTLMTFGSNFDNLPAEYFEVTGIPGGQVKVAANAITFTVPLPFVITRGVTVSAAKGKSRKGMATAIFTITNVGNTASIFRLVEGTKPRIKRSTPITLKTTLAGMDITKTLAAGTAQTASLAPGAGVQVAVKARFKPGARRKTLRVALTVISQANAGTSATEQVKLASKP